jgi:formate-dependent nitrite reductase membrane component NrfD
MYGRQLRNIARQSCVIPAGAEVINLIFFPFFLFHPGNFMFRKLEQQSVGLLDGVMYIFSFSFSFSFLFPAPHYPHLPFQYSWLGKQTCTWITCILFVFLKKSFGVHLMFKTVHRIFLLYTFFSSPRTPRLYIPYYLPFG